jgi:hypothetical protein
MDFWGYTTLQSTGVANFNIPAKVKQLIKTCDFLHANWHVLSIDRYRNFSHDLAIRNKRWTFTNH